MLLRADLLTALRIVFQARISVICLWLLAALGVAVVLAAQFSARQPATVALDTGLSLMRLALPLLVVLLVQELFVREFERKLFLNSFTYPRPRLYWLLGRVGAIVVVATGLLLIMGLGLASLLLLISKGYPQATAISLGLPYWITIAMIGVDILVVIAVATLLAITAKTPSFVLIGTIGFTLIARSYTPIIELLRNNPYVVEKIADPRIYQDSLGMLAFLLPDLGRLDVRMIALYDKMAFLPHDWLLLLIASLAYVAALLGVAGWVLNKREFS